MSVIDMLVHEWDVTHCEVRDMCDACDVSAGAAHV